MSKYVLLLMLVSLLFLDCDNVAKISNVKEGDIVVFDQSSYYLVYKNFSEVDSLKIIYIANYKVKKDTVSFPYYNSLLHELDVLEYPSEAHYEKLMDYVAESHFKGMKSFLENEWQPMGEFKEIKIGDLLIIDDMYYFVAFNSYDTNNFYLKNHTLNEKEISYSVLKGKEYIVYKYKSDEHYALLMKMLFPENFNHRRRK